MKRIVSIILLVVMMTSLCLSFVGCGPADDGKLHIKFYSTMGENLRKVAAQYIKVFEALYPEYKVDHESIGSYDDVRDQIATEITAGKQPNIAYCYPDHVALYNLALAVKTLDGYIDSTEVITRADGSTEILGLTDEQKADFIQAYYEEGRQFGDDLMYTLPMSKSTEVLYYNKTYFEVAQKVYTSDVALDLNGNPVEGNLPNPNKGNEMYNIFVPTTWDEMELICERIIGIENDRLPADKKANAAKTETTKNGYTIYLDKDGVKLAQVVPLGYDSEANWFITMCEQLGLPYTKDQGVDSFLFDTPAHHEFVTKFREWYLKGYFTTEGLHGTYTSSLFTAQTGTKSYMSIGSSAGATHQRPKADATGKYPFEVGIESIPQWNPDDPKVISQGPSLCIFEASEEEMKASWLFVKFLCTNVGFQADFSRESGYVPVIKSVNSDPIYADFLANADGGDNVAALSVKVCLEQEDYYYTSPAFNGSSKARDEVGKLMQAAFKLSPDTADVPGEIKKLFAKAINECKYQVK